MLNLFQHPKRDKTLKQVQGDWIKLKHRINKLFFRHSVFLEFVIQPEK